MSATDKLKSLETRIAMFICNSQPITRGEAEGVEKLRRIVGKKYDAINQVWLPL